MHDEQEPARPSGTVHVEYFQIDHEINKGRSNHTGRYLSDISRACHGNLRTHNERKEKDAGIRMTSIAFVGIPSAQGCRNVDTNGLEIADDEEPIALPPSNAVSGLSEYHDTGQKASQTETNMFDVEEAMINVKSPYPQDNSTASLVEHQGVVVCELCRIIYHRLQMREGAIGRPRSC